MSTDHDHTEFLNAAAEAGPPPTPTTPINAAVSTLPNLSLAEVNTLLEEVRHQRDTSLGALAFEDGYNRGVAASRGSGPNPLNEQLLHAAKSAVEWCGTSGAEFPWLTALRHAVGEAQFTGDK